MLRGIMHLTAEPVNAGYSVASRLQGIRPSVSPRVHAQHTAISVISSSSAPSSIDTVRLLKGLCAYKKGKAFNF